MPRFEPNMSSTFAGNAIINIVNKTYNLRFRRYGYMRDDLLGAGYEALVPMVDRISPESYDDIAPTAITAASKAMAREISQQLYETVLSSTDNKKFKRIKNTRETIAKEGGDPNDLQRISQLLGDGTPQEEIALMLSVGGIMQSLDNTLSDDSEVTFIDTLDGDEPSITIPADEYLAMLQAATTPLTKQEVIAFECHSGISANERLAFREIGKLLHCTSGVAERHYRSALVKLANDTVYSILTGRSKEE